MSLNSLEEIASYIVSEGKGILAADESNPTCGKRFDSIGVESNEDNRRDYREMLFRSNGMKGNIGGVILFDETIRQKAKDGTPLIDIISDQGALPGIKVDKGLQHIGDSEETVTVGLDGLDERLKEYVSMGAKFTKWRAVIKIGDGMPSDECINANMKALADYAKLVQDNGMVPMVEPEVLMDGGHSIEQASIDEVAKMTIDCLLNNVPSSLPGITFLSGGQSDILATAHLNAMNKLDGLLWKVSFSYGRALQASALKAWMGKPENIFISQDALSHRAKMNKLASLGEWDKSLEDE